eukprot:364913-Chlamydomonas_euryale.AAC.5
MLESSLVGIWRDVRGWDRGVGRWRWGTPHTTKRDCMLAWLHAHTSLSTFARCAVRRDAWSEREYASKYERTHARKGRLKAKGSPSFSATSFVPSFKNWQPLPEPHASLIA